MDKGTASNFVSAGLLGFCLLQPEVHPGFYSASLFAFSGGITNWLAVKMLFDRIPGLVGSGVIPARFREIRAKVKGLILEHFFDRQHLETFFREHASQLDLGRYLKTGEPAAPGATPRSPFAGVIEQQWEKLTSPEIIQPLIDRQLERLKESPMGSMILMVGVDKVRPVINQFVTEFIGSMQQRVVEYAGRVGPENVNLELDHDKIIDDVRSQVEVLLQAKLEQLHARDVKKMMEDVIRQHLGWLVVWGNVFGGLLGVGAYLLGQRG